TPNCSNSLALTNLRGHSQNARRFGQTNCGHRLIALISVRSPKGCQLVATPVRAWIKRNPPSGSAAFRAVRLCLTEVHLQEPSRGSASRSFFCDSVERQSLSARSAAEPLLSL